MGGLTPLQLIKQICSGVGTPQIKLLNEYFPETLGQAGWLPAVRAQCNLGGHSMITFQIPHTLYT